MDRRGDNELRVLAKVGLRPRHVHPRADPGHYRRHRHDHVRTVGCEQDRSDRREPSAPAGAALGAVRERRELPNHLAVHQSAVPAAAPGLRARRPPDLRRRNSPARAALQQSPIWAEAAPLAKRASGTIASLRTTSESCPNKRPGFSNQIGNQKARRNQPARCDPTGAPPLPGRTPTRIRSERLAERRRGTRGRV